MKIVAQPSFRLRAYFGGLFDAQIFRTLATGIIAAAMLGPCSAVPVAAQESCTINNVRGTGYQLRTREVPEMPAKAKNASGKSFIMVSAFHLEPYSDEFLKNTLSEISRANVSGIVYGTLGATDYFLQGKGSSVTEEALNKKIFETAREYGANLWLQLRLYDNQIDVGGGQGKNLTAEEIIGDPNNLKAFRAGVAKTFSLYNSYFAPACTVVVFEEAGIYHAPDAGGRFWSSQTSRLSKQNHQANVLFADRMTKIFSTVQSEIKKANPSCSVGFHLGHSTLDDEEAISPAIAELKAKGTFPDFLLYDFYLKSQRHFAQYENKLRNRVALARKLGFKVYHLSQLHTMNGFGHGLGRTPSRKEIDQSIALDDDLKVEGMGYYTKNARATQNFDEDPFDPNKKAQTTVFDSSKDRWEYGLSKLAERQGSSQDLALVVEPTSSSPGPRPAQNIWITSDKNKTWKFVGVVPPAKEAKPFVFRRLPPELYAGTKISLCSVTGDGAKGAPTSYKFSFIKDQTSENFLTDAEIVDRALRSQPDSVVGNATGKELDSRQ